MRVELRTGFDPARRSRTVTGRPDSSMPEAVSEMLSAETSAQPPLQVPLSYANRSTQTLDTSAADTPGRFAATSLARFSS